MEGWELDGSIYPVAREHMGLQQLEDSGALVSFPTCKAQRCYLKSDWLGVSSLASSCCCCKEGLCRTPASISALHTRHERPMQQSVDSNRNAQCMKCIDAHLSTCSTKELE